MTPTLNILRGFGPVDKLRILTIPSDPIFDHLWKYSKDSVYLLVDGDNYSHLPEINIINGIKLNESGFDILVALETEIERAIELSNSLHIPLLVVSFSGRQLRCSYQLCLGERQNFISSFVKFPQVNITKQKNADILCRHDTKEQIQPIFSQPVHSIKMNPVHRREQYEKCRFVVNLHKDIYCPELEECLSAKIPCFTIHNRFHTNIPSFSTLDELKLLIQHYNGLSAEVDCSAVDIYEEIHSVGMMVRENAFHRI